MDIRTIGKEAGLTAFLALMLALPMAGFRTVGASSGLTLEFRPLYVVVPVIVAFVGRILVLLFWGTGDTVRSIRPVAKG